MWPDATRSRAAAIAPCGQSPSATSSMIQEDWASPCGPGSSAALESASPFRPCGFDPMTQGHGHAKDPHRVDAGARRRQLVGALRQVVRMSTVLGTCTSGSGHQLTGLREPTLYGPREGSPAANLQHVRRTRTPSEPCRSPRPMLPFVRCCMSFCDRGRPPLVRSVRRPPRLSPGLLDGCAPRCLGWPDLAEGRLRLDRLCRNGRRKLSSPDGKPSFLARQESPRPPSSAALRLTSASASSIASGRTIAIEAAIGATR